MRSNAAVIATGMAGRSKGIRKKKPVMNNISPLIRAVNII